MNGTDTPKDLNSRLKVLELFTLHVLPRNEEWEYARSFIVNSDVLDEERREAFLQTLQELQDVWDKDSFQDTEEPLDETPLTELQPQQEPDNDGQIHQSENIASPPQGAAITRHKRTSSELDYGIEKAHPNGTSQVTNSLLSSSSKKETSVTETTVATNVVPTPQPKPTASAPVGRSQLSPPAQTPRSRPTRRSKQAQTNDLMAKARNMFRALQNIAGDLASAIARHPTVVFRFLMFILTFIVMFSRPEIRDRVRRIVATSWQKLKRTVGMGVKVTYI